MVLIHQFWLRVSVYVKVLHHKWIQVNVFNQEDSGSDNGEVNRNDDDDDDDVNIMVALSILHHYICSNKLF